MSHNWQLRLVLAIAGLLAVWSTPAPVRSAEGEAVPEAVDAEGAALQQKVISGIRENYARLPAVQCKAVMTMLDSTVKERKVTTSQLANGGRITVTWTPRASQDMEMIFRGDNFRVDRINPETGEHSASAMYNGIWTDYAPGNKWAGRWFRRDMGGVMNLDLRNSGATGQKELLLVELSELRVTRHERFPSGHGERLSLDLERTIPEADLVIKSRWEFDTQRNYLPCRVVAYSTDHGKISNSLDLEYQEVLPNRAWFVSKSTQRYFGIAGADSPDQKTWTQQTTIEVQGPVRLLDSIADEAFEVKIAPTIFLRDNTRKQSGSS